jgi:hypothetical protein
MEKVVIFNGHLEYITVIWYILFVNLRKFSTFFPVLVYYVKKNLAVLIASNADKIKT